MLTNFWVIAQLIVQFCTIALLCYATIFGLRALRYWSIRENSQRQLNLERQNYLVSAIMQLCLWFQGICFLMFLHTINEYLPPLIKGAMCATGTLNANEWGYYLLTIKCLDIFVYALYLFFEHLDNREPAYPLTPSKYYLLLLAFFCALAELFFVLSYYANLKPNIITTCCSVDFTASNPVLYGLLGDGQFYANIFIGLFGLLLMLLFFQKRSNIGLSFATLFVAVLYTVFGVYALKYFFVKYIYGLPTHQCLFDIFFSQYYRVGYFIFGAYYLLLISVLLRLSLYVVKHKIKQDIDLLDNYLRFMAIVGLFFSFILPCLYYFWGKYQF